MISALAERVRPARSGIHTVVAHVCVSYHHPSSCKIARVSGACFLTAAASSEAIESGG